jgi:hypothetical protein
MNTDYFFGILKYMIKPITPSTITRINIHQHFLVRALDLLIKKEKIDDD